MQLTSRYRFVASHRLDLPSLSREENVKLFGKCNNPHGHGHDYCVDITVEGPVDADGQIVNRAQLDAVVKEHIVAKFDYKNLNCDVPEFGGLNPTTENLAEVIRASLAEHWTLRPRLARITIVETPKNKFVLELPE